MTTQFERFKKAIDRIIESLIYNDTFDAIDCLVTLLDEVSDKKSIEYVNEKLIELDQEIIHEEERCACCGTRLEIADDDCIGYTHCCPQCHEHYDLSK